MRANKNLDPGAIVARVTSVSVRRATLVEAVATLLASGGGGRALMLDPGTDASAAGDGGGEAAAATRELRSQFGGDPIVVLVRGRLTGMLLTEDVARMLSLEGCISGNVPRDAKPAAPVCSDFAKRKPVQVVYGPGTFINEAAGQILDRINFDRGREAAEADRAAREARRVARRRGLSEAQQEQVAQEARRVVMATRAPRAPATAGRCGPGRPPAWALRGPAGAVRPGGSTHRHGHLRPTRAGAGGAVRAEQRAGAQQSGIRPAAGVRAEPRCRGPEAPVRVPVPAQRRGR